MKHRSSIVIAIVLLALGAGGPRVETAAVTIPLTIQEAIYPGSVAGITRSGDPVTVGIPLPDDATNGVTDVSQLTLSGASAGQFRVLGRWPSGRIKWVLVDTVASLNAGGTATGISLGTGGTGNFGGANLAVDNGATITVATGPATFTIRKANYNGFQQVVVNGKTVVAAGASSGLVVAGPAPGGTTCAPGTCTTLYSSVNDATSTAVIEENGPVRTVIRATGTHKDASGTGYMKFTVRMHFYKGLTRVKAVTTLRNADNGASDTTAVAFKGFGAYEWRVTANLGSSRVYDIARHGGGVETGSIGGSDEVYLYQGESLYMKEADWCGYGCVSYTSDSGYVIRKNGATLASGSNTQAPGGWADVRDTSGAGVSIGVYQMAAYWPKSLEFMSGGSEVRVGIWARQNSRTVHQAWPQWSTNELYFNFHDTATAPPANEFLKFQHYLIARAPYTHYNSTQVFGMYPMIDPSVEQAFYQNTAAAAVPALSPSNAWPYLDKGTTDTANWNLPIYRFKDWGAPGGGNQMELRWSYFMNWITRGMSGRYVEAMHFYRFMTDDVFPHSDGFTWRSQPGLDAQGRPNRTSANSGEAHRAWIDTNHAHWYGFPDYYFLTGDELAKEQLTDGVQDYYTTPNTYQVDGLLASSRSVGAHLIGAARLATFLNAIGDSAAATTVLDNATSLYNLEVKKELCPTSDASITGCTPNLDDNIWHEGSTPGVSRVRGVHWSYGVVTNWCGASVRRRIHSTFPTAILIQGILELRDVKGTAWNDYYNALDLAYGISQASLTETYHDSGSGRWDDSGFRPNSLIDMASACPGAPDDSNYEVGARATIWAHFYPQFLVNGNTTGWDIKARVATQKMMGALRVNWHENGSYQVSTMIDMLNRQGTPTLQDVAITNVTSNGGGAYTIHWTVPANVRSYRIKWAPKQIVPWIGFDSRTGTFIGNPTTTTAWFAASNVPSLPAPASPGSTQSLTINTGTTGLSAGNFSVKAYVGGSGGSTAPPPNTSASNLTLISGNNQAGAIGTALANPLTVRVTNSSGTAVAGVNVTFAVTAGGGTLSSTVVATNTSGLASTMLTLGSSSGANAVSASSSGLAGSPILFTATASTSTDTPPGSIPTNTWVNITPTYQGAPNGGQLTPFTYNNMGVYDPVTKRTINYDRWYDPIRSMSIYANALLAFDVATKTVTVLKVGNWADGKDPMPANATDPTPIDRHPLGGLALDPTQNAIYLVNGANQSGRAFYPDHPNDTWKFSLSSGTWTKVADGATDVHPPSDASNYAGMVYDPPTGKLAYFVVTGESTRTWLFDPKTNKWSAVAEDASAKNVFISIAGITYDTSRNLVVAFGGGYSSVSPPSPKLWAYSVSQNKWTALPNAPVGGEAAEFAYDSKRDVFLALVGQTTLIYNPRTSTWKQIAATLDRGVNMNRQSVTYNPAQDVFVFQGGNWENPVWSLFRYDDASSPPVLTAPGNLRIIK